MPSGILPCSFWDHVRELLSVVHLRRVNERPDEKVEEHQYVERKGSIEGMETAAPPPLRAHV
jgi:hypothetical protein